MRAGPGCPKHLNPSTPLKILNDILKIQERLAFPFPKGCEVFLILLGFDIADIAYLPQRSRDRQVLADSLFYIR